MNKEEINDEDLVEINKLRKNEGLDEINMEQLHKMNKNDFIKDIFGKIYEKILDDKEMDNITLKRLSDGEREMVKITYVDKEGKQRAYIVLGRLNKRNKI